MDRYHCGRRRRLLGTFRPFLLPPWLVAIAIRHPRQDGLAIQKADRQRSVLARTRSSRCAVDAVGFREIHGRLPSQRMIFVTLVHDPTSSLGVVNAEPFFDFFYYDRRATAEDRAAGHDRAPDIDRQASVSSRGVKRARRRRRCRSRQAEYSTGQAQ